MFGVEENQEEVDLTMYQDQSLSNTAQEELEGEEQQNVVTVNAVLMYNLRRSFGWTAF